MRNIKFRGKDYKTGQWVFGDLVMSHNRRNKQTPYIVIVYNHGGRLWIDNRKRIIPDTISQFTGLLDMNGNEIYEGDYIEVHKSCFGGVVTWHPHGYFYIKELYKFKYDEEPDCLPLGKFIEDTKRKVTIIDNIHDNPELLND